MAFDNQLLPIIYHQIGKMQEKSLLKLPPTKKESGIGSRLRQVVEKMGYESQSGFINHSGLLKATFYAIIREDRKPSLKTKKKLEAVGINTEWLLTGEGEMLLAPKPLIDPSVEIDAGTQTGGLPGDEKYRTLHYPEARLMEIYADAAAGKPVNKDDLFHVLFEILSNLEDETLVAVKSYIERLLKMRGNEKDKE